MVFDYILRCMIFSRNVHEKKTQFLEEEKNWYKRFIRYVRNEFRFLFHFPLQTFDVNNVCDRDFVVVRETMWLNYEYEQ